MLDAPSFKIPNTKGIGELLSVDFMPPPKSNEAGELNEKTEDESPSSLRFWVVVFGESENLCREGRSG